MPKRTVIFIAIGIALGIGVYANWYISTEHANDSPTNLPAHTAPDSSDGADNTNGVTGNTEPAISFHEQDISANNRTFTLRLPEGYTISVFADDFEKPRDVAFGPNGTLLVSDFDAGEVIALRHQPGDTQAGERVTVVDGLEGPQGIITRCENGTCQLYVAETELVSVFDLDTETLRATNKRALLALPGGTGHSTRSLLLLPVPQDDTLLVSVGSSCNVCFEDDERRATIMYVNIETGESGVYATGLRNAVNMARHPETNEIWATENGRDRLGDDLPPDELNVITQGTDYGWPVCYGSNTYDEQFDGADAATAPCDGKQPGAVNVQAHSAPLGLDFIPLDGWPAEWRTDLLVGYHGSWNRTIPTGYKVVKFKATSEPRYEKRVDFISGWLGGDGTVYGRPVDVLATEDGELFITDDHAGVIYLVRPVK